MTGSYDPELNLVYWGVGNPSSDFYGGNRTGDNLYTGAVVALDADTGKLKWHYQEVPHDVYDFDAAYEPTLIDVTRDGKTQKLLVHTNKGGYVWVLDRVTGKYVNAWPHIETLNWAKGFDKDGHLIDRLKSRSAKALSSARFGAEAAVGIIKPTARAPAGCTTTASNTAE